MRLPFVAATMLVSADIIYRAFLNPTSDNANGLAKGVISWGITLLVIGTIGITSFGTLADVFSYIIITIIVLNDGYDFMSLIAGS